MTDRRYTRFFLLAAVASGSLMLLATGASAQTVRIFDDTPSVDQLRSIMVPESHPGLTRSIVIQRPDAMARPSSVQLAASHDAGGEAPPAAVPMPAKTAAPAAPPPAPVSSAPVQDAGIVGFRVNFAFDSAALPASSFDFLQRIAELMNEEPQIKLQVEGHTDAKGSPEYNLGLSKRRALSVAEYLVEKCGISPDRLVLVGKGMTEPLTDDGFDPRNRRVQFVRVS
jgi:outer membrane protein OmpA-like peptidoglycan-associated protein